MEEVPYGATVRFNGPLPPDDSRSPSEREWYEGGAEEIVAGESGTYLRPVRDSAGDWHQISVERRGVKSVAILDRSQFEVIEG